LTDLVRGVSQIHKVRLTASHQSCNVVAESEDGWAFCGFVTPHAFENGGSVM